MNPVLTKNPQKRTIFGAVPGSKPNTCDVSLIIPTRNEQENIPALIDKLSRVLDYTGYEVILVDDSEDDTPQVASMAAADCGLNLSVIHRKDGERQGGLSTAALTGITSARGTYACIMDADLQHPPELIAEMLAATTEQDADIVIASRYVEGGNDSGLNGWSRRLISRASKMLVKTLFRGRLQAVADPLSGFFLVRRSLLDDTALRPIGFKILLDILIRSDWQAVAEVPLQFGKRTNGSSKATLKQGRDFLAHVVRLLWESKTGAIEATGAGSGRLKTNVTRARS